MRRMTARLKSQRTRRASVVLAPLFLLTVLFSAESCDVEDPPTSGAKSESKIQTSNFDRLAKKQPAHSMDYSPTRDSKNFWIDTWGQKGKVSYVYLLSNGKPWAFVVIKRLPVDYCTGLVPNMVPRKFDFGSDAGGVVNVPAPSIDATYSSGTNCNRLYGEDATTGAYVDWTVGADTTMVLRDQPLPLNLYVDAIPLGDTTAQQAAGADDDMG